MDFLFAKELTSVEIIRFNCNICISLILSSKVNKVDFKCLKGSPEKVAVVSSTSSLKVIKNKFDRIW